jgi:hypothetical protein
MPDSSGLHYIKKSKKFLFFHVISNGYHWKMEKKKRRGSASKSEMLTPICGNGQCTLYKSTFCFSKHLPLLDANFCSTRVLASKYTREIFIGCVKYGHNIRMFKRVATKEMSKI